MRQTYRYLKKSCPEIPEIRIQSPEIMDGYLGPGYGHRTESGDRARRLMEDKEGIDHKFVGVALPKVDPVFGVWEDVSDIPEATRNRIKHFFETYKTLEPGKWVKVKNWLGRKQAAEKLKLLK